MAVLVGESLLDCRGFDGYDMFSRFRRWAEAEPKDIGLQTETVLTCGLPWDQAADDYLNHNLRAAGNGSLMRTATAAVYYARSGNAATMDAARRISALTHGDPAAGEGCAILHELIRTALNGGDPLEVLDDVLDQVYPEQRERWAAVLDPHWHPDKATENNGAVWPALGTAVWALRTADDFEDALRRAVDQGGDTDTVAAVTGALSGAVYGLEAVPDRWLAQVHVPLPGSGVRVLGDSALRLLAQRLEAEGGAPGS
jgi:ADP-ribosylglycohydrolase